MKTATEIAQSLNMRRNGRSWLGDCPACGYRQSCSLSEKDGSPVLYCHACQDPKSVWQIIKIQNHEYITAKVAKHAKLPPNQMALKLWENSLPAQGTAVSEYLKARGFMQKCPDDVRYLPKHKHAESGLYFPVMLSAVRDKAGIVRAVHRTFLKSDGSGKASVNPAKMSLGPLVGASVHLASAGPILAISEGIETGLSVMQETGLPVWAALSTAGMIGLELPEVAQQIFLMADNDAPGLKAAKAAATKWACQGRTIKIVFPPIPGSDFNDLLRAN